MAWSRPTVHMFGTHKHAKKMQVIRSRIPAPPSRSTPRLSKSDGTTTASPSSSTPSMRKEHTMGQASAHLVGDLPLRSANPQSRSHAPKVQSASTYATTSPYISAHLGEPCTFGSLDHILACGHKVLTLQPEACASNCHQPRSPLVNPRRVDEPFNCLACITEDIRTKLERKADSFRDELEVVARETGKQDEMAWIRKKVEIVGVAWKDQALGEICAKIKGGRMCRAFYLDPEFEQLVETAVQRRVEAKKIERPVMGPDRPKAQAVVPLQEDICHLRPPRTSSPSSSSGSRSSSRSGSRLPVRKR
ncbi:hypothetical protein LTR09_001756 [Extremus antarcticus]|uniref:Uncharacterized protein n=1 Tax=Extremus antarcticus TaxID=702011 RepID=A0AAJ0LW72_9PEZI|nr:hypothetical protein LTR09_001756 [Extremus antarcticus]